ncbi:hypothetical protein [Chloroflexus sp.]|uniref:hypothetical protein n=1 Tax=Chloroflexus sp. TaxID=1904827 RepID=UPI00404AAC68
MSRLDITIKYKDKSFERSLTSSDTVHNIIYQIVRDQKLPEYEDGKAVTYGLYIRDNKGEESLDNDLQIGERCRSGDILYLADKNNLWWNNSNDTRQVPLPPSPLPTLEPREKYGCRLHIHNGKTLALERSESVLINRSFILSNLFEGERMRIKLGLDDTIRRVSRDKHCRIYAQGDLWYVKAYRTVYVDSRQYGDHQVVPLPRKATLLIGEHGWPIEVELFPV